MQWETISGRNTDHTIKLFTLSTCGWCKKTKDLFKKLEYTYKFADIDLQSPQDQDSIRKELQQYNPRLSYPTIVIDDGKHVIIGFKKEDILEALS